MNPHESVVDEDLLAPPEEDDLAPPPEEVEFTQATAVETVALVEVLPADFELPRLIRFAPDVRLRVAADADAEKLLAIDPKTRDDLTVLDRALGHQRAHVQTLEAHFQDAKDTAFKVHRRITSTLAEWLQASRYALDQGNDRYKRASRRFDAEDEERRRQQQAEEDRRVREEAARAAAAAEAAQAPAAVVEQLREEAKTATAPPLPMFDQRRQTTATTSVVANWKARLQGTDPAALNPQPVMADLPPALVAKVHDAMRAVLEGKAPLTIFEIDWTTLNSRAKSDKKTFAIPGFEAYDAGSTRGKPGARK